MIQRRYDLKKDERYLQLSVTSFLNIVDAATEIINLEATVHLPKGTEHFFADIHGEYQAFQHVFKNASGNTKRKVNELFGERLRNIEKQELCTLIYYPEQKLELVKRKGKDIKDWYHITIHRLIKVCRDVLSKYIRSKVRRSLPDDLSHIVQELLHEHADDKNKIDYVSAIIKTVISTGRAGDLIITICEVIQRLVIDQLHTLSDVYDRGPGVHIVMDTLKNYHSWDTTWGNHDILWMGACAGNDACICNAIRIALRYANMATTEDGYGINLIQLATFAMDAYGDDPCEEFMPKTSKDNPLDERSKTLAAQMHKATNILQSKIKSQMISRHPLWKMADRRLLKTIDYKKGTIIPDGKEYKMCPRNLPTIDLKNSEQPTEAEQAFIDRPHRSFIGNEKLRNHIRSLLRHGRMYDVFNHNLFYHASIPLMKEGKLKEVETGPGVKLKGRELPYQTGMKIRSAFQTDNEMQAEEERQDAIDFFLSLWCGPDSPPFDKTKMATFEHYFTGEKETHHEEKGYYFGMHDNEETADMILDESDVSQSDRHTINGHVPVHVVKDENPIKANGKLMVIDGGFSQVYHKETGIAGYALAYHPCGLQLVQYEPFTSAEDTIKRGTDIASTIQIVEMNQQRLRVEDTDEGTELRLQIEALKELLRVYRCGFLTEHEHKTPPRV